MSLVTRCPACATTFKVVRDQLRISDGWVRCGRCSEVFDANADLHEESEVLAVASPAADHASVEADSEARIFAEPEPALFVDSPAPAPAQMSPAPGIVLDDEPWPDFLVPETPAPPPVSTLYPAFPDIDLNMPAPPVLARAAAPDDNAEDDDADNVQFQKALRRARVKAAKAARAARQAEAKVAEKSAQSPSVAVLQTASEPASAATVTQAAAPPTDPAPTLPRPARARRWLWPAVMVAGLLLVLQVVHHNRDLIAARQPSLRPALEALCGVTGCELSALRRISDIVIDGAAFSRAPGGDGYRLSFTLRNGATVPIATPAVELTLLDTQERAVVRRVLRPAEFAAPVALSARAEHAASLPLTLNANDAAALPPVAGYRVVAFYP